jgi:hypothetical protein
MLPVEPWYAASPKAKTPPSSPTSQYPWPPGGAVVVVAVVVVVVLGGGPPVVEVVVGGAPVAIGTAGKRLGNLAGAP